MWDQTWLSDSIREYLRTLARFFGVLAGLAFVTGFVSAFSLLIGLFLVLSGGLTAMLALAIGAVIFFAEGVRRAREARGHERAIALFAVPVLVVTTVVSALPLLSIGGLLGEFARLGVNQARYDKIVALARAERKPVRYAEKAGITYSVDLGPPLRVAFDPEGLIDNWSGIVFDPSGEVMLADGFDPSGKFHAPDRVTKLFGGDLVRCRHLWGKYYSCSFT